MAPDLHRVVLRDFTQVDCNPKSGGTLMLLLKIALALGCVALMASLSMAQDAGSTPPKADKRCSPEDLVGHYVIVAGERDGAKEPEDRIKGTSVTFTKDSVVVADKDKKEVYSATYKLNATTNPCDITMTSRVESSAGEIARGLIQKEGDLLRLIYALPTGEIPSGFKTKEKQLMFVMKRTQ
jgi:uncharacterized protein (TIGR03067 family)